MKKAAIVTVGLGFGDEGKGSAVDYLARKFDADLVVRYNGGHQAGHNVVLPDGTHHTFAQFGSGTFYGSRTYLGPNTIIEPVAMRTEAEFLKRTGEFGTSGEPLMKIRISNRALVTTPYHQLLNHIKEMFRAGDKHGSCGLGIGETRKYWIDHGRDSIFAGDLKCKSTCLDKLELCRERILLDMEDYLRPFTTYRDGHDAIRSKAHLIYEFSPASIFKTWRDTIKYTRVVEETPDFNTAIFEGAQGVLLDEFYGFPPFTTWSTTTNRHANEILDEVSNCDVTTLGIVRSHMSRHGAGPMPTELDETLLTDENNPFNPWQEGFRFGYLDIPLLKYACSIIGKLDGLFVTHLDNNLDKVCVEYEHQDYKFKEGFGWKFSNSKFDWNYLPSRKKQSIITEKIPHVKPIYKSIDPAVALRKYLETPIHYKSSGPTY